MSNGKCIVCGGSLHDLMRFSNMPASAQDIPTQDELSTDAAISLQLCQCSYCGLVQFDTEPVWYYKDVIRAGGGTSTMTSLRKEEYRRLLHIMEKYNIPGRSICEIGCGKGEFLQMWKDIDFVAFLNICIHIFPYLSSLQILYSII